MLIIFIVNVVVVKPPAQANVVPRAPCALGSCAGSPGLRRHHMPWRGSFTCSSPSPRHRQPGLDSADVVASPHLELDEEFMVQLEEVSVASDVASRGGDHTECGGEGVESTDAQEVEGKRRRGTERRKSRDVDGLLGSEELACRSGNGAGAEDEEVRIFRLAVFVRIFWVVWVRPAVFVRIFCVVGLGLVV